MRDEGFALGTSAHHTPAFEDDRAGRHTRMIGRDGRAVKRSAPVADVATGAM
jgi:hypothetical protein